MNEFDKELENYFCRFTFGQFVTLILLEVVTLFFVFYLGARYGPDLMGRGETVQKSALPPDDSKKVEELLSNPPTDYSYPKALSDEAKGDEAGSKSIRVKPSGMTAKEAEELIRKGGGGEKPDLEKTEPASLPDESAPPSSSLSGSGGERFSIQIASYPTESEAKQMLEKWKKRGYSAFLTSADLPGKGTWHRVRIGKFSNREEADSYLDKFKKREKVSALVVSTKN